MPPVAGWWNALGLTLRARVQLKLKVRDGSKKEGRRGSKARRLESLGDNRETFFFRGDPETIVQSEEVQ